jgi:hypothetical protein
MALGNWHLPTERQSYKNGASGRVLAAGSVLLAGLFADMTLQILG